MGRCANVVIQARAGLKHSARLARRRPLPGGLQAAARMTANRPRGDGAP